MTPITALWIALFLTIFFYAAIAFYAGWRIHRLELKFLSLGEVLDGKADKRPSTPRPRAHRVDTVFHDRDDQGREHWLCVNCGASVAKMGHTVKACEEYQDEAARAEAEEVIRPSTENEVGKNVKIT